MNDNMAKVTIAVLAEVTTEAPRDLFDHGMNPRAREQTLAELARRAQADKVTINDVLNYRFEE